MMSKRPFVVAIGSVVLAVAVLELLGPSVNGATALQVLFLVLLLAARFCGTRPALVASVFAAAGFFRYFVTPKGFAFGDPNDVGALAAFIIMAAVGGELASRAERRAREVERLYRQLQSAFERESEAEASRRNERLKATLLDAMAHNLRTPLTAIKAAVTAMRNPSERLGTGLSLEEQRELLTVIDEESDRLNRFIGGLLSAEEPADSHPAMVRPVSLNDIALAAAARAETLTRDHQMVVKVEQDLPPVAVDAASAIEVLYMLLDNASKYAPPSTTILVNATRHDSRYVCVRVIDDGPGIPANLRERVFDRFFRIPNRESHDPRRGGVGVGLALAKRLIEMQAGKIWVEGSQTGKGAIVVVLLPVATP
jgi:two-component system sensor histidine kinase KdpD